MAQRSEEWLQHANVTILSLQGRAQELEIALASSVSEVTSLSSGIADRDRIISEAGASQNALANQLEEQKRLGQEWYQRAKEWLKRATLEAAHTARQARTKLQDANSRADVAEEQVTVGWRWRRAAQALRSGPPLTLRPRPQ